MELPQTSAPHAPRLEGVLRLVFRERGGATYLADQYGRAPLKVVRPFRLGGGAVLVQVTHVAPGIMGGDACRLDITVEPGARVVVTPASATKVHSMPPDASVGQAVTLTVAAGGALGYCPGLTIPFPQAEFTQTLDVALAPGARFGMLELWAIGRIERGEYLAFRRLSSRTTVLPGDRPCYLDALEPCPAQGRPAGWGCWKATGPWPGATGTRRTPRRAATSPGATCRSSAASRPAATCTCGVWPATASPCVPPSKALLSRHCAAWGLARLSFGRYPGILG